jgi:hypothetical protein
VALLPNPKGKLGTWKRIPLNFLKLCKRISFLRPMTCFRKCSYICTQYFTMSILWAIFNSDNILGVRRTAFFRWFFILLFCCYCIFCFCFFWQQMELNPEINHLLGTRAIRHIAFPWSLSVRTGSLEFRIFIMCLLYIIQKLTFYCSFQHAVWMSACLHSPVQVPSLLIANS